MLHMKMNSNASLLKNMGGGSTAETHAKLGKKEIFGRFKKGKEWWIGGELNSRPPAPFTSMMGNPTASSRNHTNAVEA
jgi:hypothetical protein